MQNRPQVERARVFIRDGTIRAVEWLRRIDWRWVIQPAVGFALLSCLIAYLRLASQIDERLADGPFSGTSDIFCAPEVVAVNESLTAGTVIRGLERAGYTASKDNQTGWYDQQAGTVRIFPGPASSLGGGPVSLQFSGGRLVSIVSLTNHASRRAYALEPQLLANISETRERRRLVKFENIPAVLVEAVVSVEDKHFFQHAGFDGPRALKAAYVDLKDGRKREGASTLTMQLARNLWLDREKSWRRKMEEILITLHLEHKLTKQQIFEDYANEVYLGQHGTFSINGFGEGAQAFFGKDLSQIDVAEAALLAGIVRRPAYYNPLQYPDRARERRNLVLWMMWNNGYLSERDYREAAASPVETAPEEHGETAGSYFIALLNNELRDRFGDEGARNRSVYTTLDPALQGAAESAVHSGMQNVDRQLRRRRGPAIPDGQPQVALIALDPHTGEIKALVGGRDYSVSQLNHVLASRQPGSVFKPFVYAAAVSTAVEGGPRIFTPASVLDDESTTFYFGGGAYQPRDFHDDYMGETTLRTALAHSLNVATVSLAQQVGYRRVVAMAQRLGLNSNIKATPSVALGAYEATPLEIAGAYTTFANNGVQVHPTTILSMRSREGVLLYRHVPDSHAALDPRVNYLMVNMMQEVLRSGTGVGVRERGFTLPAAGKTGTSRDGWFAGFTSELLCVVWVGFDDNRDLNLEGARSALPIWAEFMKRAAQIGSYGAVHDFSRPGGIASEEICEESGQLATEDCPNRRTEIFIAGTQPTRECDLHSHGTIVNGEDGQP